MDAWGERALKLCGEAREFERIKLSRKILRRYFMVRERALEFLQFLNRLDVMGEL